MLFRSSVYVCVCVVDERDRLFGYTHTRCLRVCVSRVVVDDNEPCGIYQQCMSNAELFAQLMSENGVCDFVRASVSI